MRKICGVAAGLAGTPGRGGAYIAVEEGYYETVELREGRGGLRAGVGHRHPHCGHIPGGVLDVHCGIFIDRLRHLLYAAVKGGKKMRIIVWKAPGFLRGILRCLFCGKE